MKTESCTGTIATPPGAPAQAMAARLERGLPTPAESLVALWRTLIRWQRRHEGRRALAQLDARLLADVGLTREQAEAESRKPFWRA